MPSVPWTTKSTFISVSDPSDAPHDPADADPARKSRMVSLRITGRVSFGNAMNVRRPPKPNVVGTFSSFAPSLIGRANRNHWSKPC